MIRVSGKELERIKRGDNLQGIVAQVRLFDYEFSNSLLQRSENERLTLVCLDNIQDPHNLGSIIRTLACLVGFAIVIHKHNSCDVNETVLYVACAILCHEISKQSRK